MSVECASGCSLRGEHLPECTGVVIADGCEAECRGCLPRPAEVGRLCSWCWGRLQSVVRTMPALVDHLREMGEPGVSSAMGRSSGVRGTRRPGEGMLYPEALVVADELHAVLATWCTEVAQERPGADGARLVGLTRWTADGAGALGPREGDSTRRLVAWLDPHLEWCAQQVWAGDLLADVAALAASAAARFPVEERERRVETVRCPTCGARSLVVVPPSVVGADVVVRCTLPVCGLVLSEEDWGRTRALAVEIARSLAHEVGE